MGKSIGRFLMARHICVLVLFHVLEAKSSTSVVEWQLLYKITFCGIYSNAVVQKLADFYCENQVKCGLNLRNPAKGSAESLDLFWAFHKNFTL